jgi:hypothetical protein
MRGSASKKTLFASEQDRPDVARKRLRWKTHQGKLDPTRLVFIDETWAKTNMTRLRGWAPRGRKLVAKVPHGHWRTLTFLAALRCDRIDAPCVFDGPINGQSFTAYIEQFLVPTLAPTLLRKADERTVEDTWRRIGTLLDAFSPAECASYIRNAGYASN